MLRSQTLVTLKEYHSALFDVNRLLDLNPSSEVYQNLQARLKTQLSLAPIPESEAELEEEEDEAELEEEEEDKDEAEPNRNGEEEQYEDVAVAVDSDKKAELSGTDINAEVIALEMRSSEESYRQERDKSETKKISSTTVVIAPKMQSDKELFEQDPKGWQTIPKPKGHTTLDYARWDRVEDDSSEEDDDDDEESQPQYRFRVRTIGVRPVK
ncbi:hypothetical protein FH972_019412 [Carpinus fangiana]|uniref:Uncharacterized protein n=1 Tax=Carpinus fangiana TaxID=176857 RepID=A0A5N6RRK1_9ROSI|nr:hypothetical protein FH972_019412 [Carpinus fangiana]